MSELKRFFFVWELLTTFGAGEGYVYVTGNAGFAYAAGAAGAYTGAGA